MAARAGETKVSSGSGSGARMGAGQRSTAPGSPRARPGPRRERACRPLLAVDAVEAAAVAEVLLLRLRPAAEHLVDGEQLDRGELRRVLRRHLRVARPVVVPRGDL